jgi:histidinol-phosphate/aromatic aminotransferase/cobyric acid decarboxylase-like protein
MNTTSISRRKFAQLLGAGAACAIVKPAFSLAVEPAAKSPITSVVRLSSNENPYGPSAKAHAAMNGSFDVCCRYPDEANDVLIEKIAGAVRAALSQANAGAPYLIKDIHASVTVGSVPPRA